MRNIYFFHHSKEILLNKTLHPFGHLFLINQSTINNLQVMTNTYIIGITGGSGSGKTTLLKQVEKMFLRERVCIISQDDYYRPRGEQKIDEKGIKNFDLPYSIDSESFTNDIKLLIEGKTVTRQEYVFNNSNATPKIRTFRPAPVVIVEGLFIFHFEAIKKLIDLKIFVHAPDHLKIIRRIKRDRIERNYPLEDVLYRYEHHVQPSYKKYIEPYLNESDIIINNNDEESLNKGLKVLKGFLNELC